MFYRGSVESILSSCIIAWFGNCNASDRKTLQRIGSEVHSPTVTEYTGAPEMDGVSSSLRVFALRCGPGQELLSSLLAFVEERQLKAPFIITCVGSVTRATLRLANATADNTNEVIRLQERFEIVSLVGTLNREAHLHICLADKEGKTIGGHVLGDLEVFTTAEVVIGEATDLHFTREMDSKTGFPELVIEKRAEQS